jgi:tripartite-type tricarboxylate transporter receptor subunit TctC
MVALRWNAVMPTRRGYVGSIVVLAALGLAQPAQCQEWPQRPVKIIVPTGAGGHTDGIARVIGQDLGDTFGQQFVVENRAGAAGSIATEAVAHSPADGYTLFMASPSQISIAPAVTKTRYDPVRDFAPISIVGTNPKVFVIHQGMPVKSLAEFVDYVRKQPNRIAFADTGTGSISHLSTALFLKRAQLDMFAVSYKAATQIVADVMAGHVATYFTNLSDVLPHAASGALRFLAVSGEKRAPQAPDVPTFIESGYPGFKILTWNGLMAPAGTPKEIIERVAKEVARAVKDPKIVERLIANGVDPVGSSPDEFAAMIAADIALWAEAVKIAGVQEK